MTYHYQVSVRLTSFLVGACAAAVVAAAPVLATPLTFAQYIQSDGAEQQWSISSSGGTSVISASGSGKFSFSGVVGSPFVGPESVNFTLSATSNQLGNCGVSCGPGDSYVQPGYTGAFSFIDTGSAPGANLLSGTFAVTNSPSTTGAQFSSSIGSSGGNFNSSSTSGNLSQLVLTSSYIGFTDAVVEDASWSLSSLIPNFSAGPVSAGKQADPGGVFDAAGTGTFSYATSATDISEPDAMSLLAPALLLIGVGLVCRKNGSGR
jgi:hypothetical protein